MKYLKKVFQVLMILTLAMTVVACGGETTTNDQATTLPPEVVTIEGEYQVDITNLGMPLIFYLKIDNEDNFYLSPDRNYTTDKGHGTVASSGNTYMFIYSDSTTEEPKTSTFEIEEGNLHFQANLPYGSSSLPASKEDEENPEIVYYLVAKALVHEEFYGEYAGEHTVSAMGSDVLYEYSLTLGVGREFSFVSDFIMGTEAYKYEESGYYDLEDGELTLYLESEEVVGNFDEERNLTIGVKASEMASRSERTLRLATTAICASTYYGYFDDEGTDILTVLTLDKFGGYTFTANDGVNEVTETGSFSITGTNLVFNPADSEESFTGTLANYVLNATFKVNDSDTVRTAVTSYCNTIQGTFSATGTDELENEYQATLILNPDATFSLLLKKGEETILEEVGTFRVGRVMFVQLILETADETTYELVISNVGLNVNFTLADETVIGFSLKK
jgi:hypothetical protein